MEKIITFLAVTILGGMVWEMGAYFGLGMAWFLSRVGSLVGVYIGWRIGQAYLG